MSYQFGHVDRDERIDLAADEPGAEPARRRGWPSPLLTVLVMAVFAGGLYFAYALGTHHAAPAPNAAPGAAALGAAAPGAAAPAGDNVPVIHADPQPMKVKPEQPGGMVVPDRDKLIYNERPGGPPVEKLLPPPERPAPRPAPPPFAPMTPAGVTPPPQEPVVVQQAPVPPAPTPPAAKPAPSRNSAAHAAAKAHPTSAAAAGAVKGGHIRIQLGSVRSPEEARDEWQRLKRLAPDLLGKLTADAVRADLGERGIYYRIEAGSFARTAAAEHLCRELKGRRLGCSIVR